MKSQRQRKDKDDTGRDNRDIDLKKIDTNREITDTLMIKTERKIEIIEIETETKIEMIKTKTDMMKTEAEKIGIETG